MRQFKIIKEIYKPRYIALNALLAVIYYLFFSYLVGVQKASAFFIFPWYLISALILTSSVLSTIAIYSIRATRNNQAKISASGLSLGTIVVGTGLCGCTTSFPILAVTTIGLSAEAVTSFGSFLINYNVIIFSVFVLANTLTISYYLNKLSSPECKVKGRVKH